MLLNRVVTLLLALALLIVVGANAFRHITQSQYLEYDEFYSLERSHGFDKFNDWLSVYSLNEPTAKKPPLQYWLNAVAINLGMRDVTALRFWSWVFFLGLLLVTAVTSLYLKPDNPWVMPAAILLLASSTQLTALARSGLLDTGMGLLMMAGLLTFLYARHQPRIWGLCGVVLGLGALQKAPVALLFIAVLLLIFRVKGDTEIRWQQLRQNRYFNRGLWITLILFLAWPILQSFKYGGDYLNVAIKQQMLNRFSPLRPESEVRSGAFDWVGWLWADLHWFAIVAGCCTLAAVLLPRWRRQTDTFAYAALALLVIAAFTLASGKIYSRYLAVLTPLMVCVSVKVMADLIPWKPAVFLIGAVFFAIAFPDIDRIIDGEERGHNYFEVRDTVAYIDRFREDSDYVLINLGLLPPGAYGYFGESRAPFRAYDEMDEKRVAKYLDKLDLVARNLSLLGMDKVESRAQLEQVMPGLQVLDIAGDTMIWRFRPSPEMTLE
ncbi:MAG: glycosyltransferase family 39 protein [Ketobacter sp.]|nr:glycosyltransferase family 39 protein [Ketobacter sp.]